METVVVVPGYEGQPRNIVDMQDMHLDKKGFFIGGGPSLLEQFDLLPELENHITFTCNRMNQWDDCPFTPDYHCITEPAAVEKADFFYWDRPGIKHIATHKKQLPESAKRQGWIWINKMGDGQQLRWQGFGGLDDELEPIRTGYTSPLTIAQLGAWMGIRNFYFLGLDMKPIGYAWNPTFERRELTLDKGTSERIRKGLREAFTRAYNDVTNSGRSMYDCTPGGGLNKEGILPYKKLSEVLK